MLRLTLALLGFLACLFTASSATALTYKLTPNEKACFFTDVQQQGAKIAFYFAVSLLFGADAYAATVSSSGRQLGLTRFYSLQVQSGGSFDVEYDVTGPNERVIMGNAKERQVDSVFTAKETGEYRFCFNNEMSTFAEKTVDFEIAVRSPYPINLRCEPNS